MRYVVRIRPLFDFAAALSVVERFGTIYAVVPEIHLIGLDADATAVSYLRDYEGVEQITEDVVAPMNGVAPNDTAWPGMWFASALGLLDAWDISTGEGINVAVLDSGVNATHADFSDKLLPGWCVITNTDTVDSVNAHGTYTTSIAVGKANNGAGVVGIAHGSMGIPIRVSTATDGASSDVYLAAGVVKAVELGARVISVSYGGLADNPSFLLAAEYARRKGAVVVGAMDNTAGTIAADASKGKDVIFVSGINSSFNRVYSNGEILWIRGPQGIPAASGTGSSYISSFGGNSAATPVVAGVCALILSIRPDLGPADVRQILAQSGNKSIISGSTGSYTTTDGHGLVNALEAVKLAKTWSPVGAGSPQIAIISPKSNETFFASDGPIQVEVVARDDVGISKVELYNAGGLIDTLYAQPFVFSITSPIGGLTRITAVAYDNLGQNSHTATSWVRYQDSVMSGAVADQECGLFELTGNGEYEVRARFANMAGVGPWSEWVQHVPPDDLIDSVSDCFAEFSGNQWKVYYTSPHAGQRLEYRFAGGAWASVLTNPLTLDGLKGSGDLELRVTNQTESSPSVLVGNFNLSRIYYVIYESGMSEPTAAQIVAGKNALDAPAAAFGSEEARLTTGLQSFLSAAGGLQENQSYRIAFVGTDGVGFSNVVVSDPPWVARDPLVSVESDASASYTIRGREHADTSAAYSIAGSVISDAVAEYAIAGAASSVVSDAHAQFAIRGAVANSAVASYAIRGAVQSDKVGAYVISGAVVSDATASYSIAGATMSVTADAVAAYAIRGVAQADAQSAYSIAGSVTSDAVISYSVAVEASAVVSDSSASYVVRGAALADASAIYAVRGSVISGGSSAYSVRSSVAVDVVASYKVRSRATADAVSTYRINGIVVADASAGYVVRGVTIADVVAGYVIGDVSFPAKPLTARVSVSALGARIDAATIGARIDAKALTSRLQ